MFVKSLDGILSSFQKNIGELEVFLEKNGSHITKVETDLQVSKKEQEKATRVIGKLKALVE